MKSIRTVDAEGTIRYHNEQGVTYRENGPSVIYTNGTCWWFPMVTDTKDHHHIQYGNDSFSRKNGVIYADGSIWYWDYKSNQRKMLDDETEGKVTFS